MTQTFNQSDFFLRIEQTTSAVISQKLLRFLNLIFSSEVVTPTGNETAMYHAFAAAGNSACLSRQVGASITSASGEIISVGWNDVPKFKGSVYTYDEDDPLGSRDFRCLNIDGGKCFNDEEKVVIRDELVKKFIDAKIISGKDEQKAIDLVKSSRIKELIEFSRAVHAEMHAIILAGNRGAALLKNAKLFCTTYPCHNCARHIVAAGISEVYYIEPYRKSLALKLHHDSITEDDAISDKVKILLFDGVSPRRYFDFFRMLPNSRKKNGLKIHTDKKQIHPKKTVSLQAIPILEKEIIRELESKSLISL